MQSSAQKLEPHRNGNLGVSPFSVRSSANCSKSGHEVGIHPEWDAWESPRLIDLDSTNHKYVLAHTMAGQCFEESSLF